MAKIKAHVEQEINNSNVRFWAKLSHEHHFKILPLFLELLQSSVFHSQTKGTKINSFSYLCLGNLPALPSVCMFMCGSVFCGKGSEFCCNSSEQTNLEWVTLGRMFGQQMLEQRLPRTQWGTEILVTDFHLFTQSGAEVEVLPSLSFSLRLSLCIYVCVLNYYCREKMPEFKTIKQNIQKKINTDPFLMRWLHTSFFPAQHCAAPDLICSSYKLLL